MWTSKRHRQTKHSALTSGARVSDLPDKFVTTTPEGYTCIAGRLFHNAATEGLEYRDDDDDESVGLEEDRRGGRREGHRDEQREEEDEETEETEEEGETAAAAAAAGRVADLSKRIALRCLHLEQECLRRERLQTRLFQEQIRGIRQVWVQCVLCNFDCFLAARCGSVDNSDSTVVFSQTCASGNREGFHVHVH